MNYQKLPPLLLTVFLQFAPACKLIQLPAMPQASPLAFVLRWATVVAGTLGAFHTVTGASAAIVGLTKYVGNTPVGGPTNNATGTVGAEFRYRITVSNAGSDHYKDYFNCIPLPPGLTISTNVGGNGFITNKPNSSLVAGVYAVTLYAGNTSYPTPVTYNATITILGGGGSPPTVTQQPTNTTVLAGGTATFTVAATGDPPPTYQWLKDDVPIAGATSLSHSVTNAQPADAGRYAARVTNSSGTTTTDTATLTVASPPTLGIASAQAGQLTLQFDAEPNVQYTVERSPTLLPGSWTTFYEFPAQPTAGTRTFTDSTTASGVQAYRVRMSLP